MMPLHQLFLTRGNCATQQCFFDAHIPNFDSLDRLVIVLERIRQQVDQYLPDSNVVAYDLRQRARRHDHRAVIDNAVVNRAGCVYAA